jgi:uncharacterized SAM-binding protein YcdF (DUF218 family)
MLYRPHAFASFPWRVQQISSLAWSLARPSSLLLVMMAAGVLLSLFGRRRSGHGLLLGAALFCLAIAILPTGDWAMASLENRYSRIPTLPEHVDGIVGLAGAVVPSLTERWHQPSLTDGGERMTSFVMLARHYPDAKLVFTGGISLPGPGHLRETDVARQLFQGLGLDPARLLLESEAKSTYENAVLSRKLAQPQPGETWLLVTSAFHMPRAMATFQHQGWAVTPFPTGFKSGRRKRIWSNIDLPLTLQSLDYACHEWIGMLVYRWRGWL